VAAVWRLDGLWQFGAGEHKLVTHEICYSERCVQVRWLGYAITDLEEFKGLLRGAVRERLTDQQHTDDVEADLKALGETGMAQDTLARVLAAGRVKRKSWEVGEALAECILSEKHEAKWPWNSERDKKTPKASLPGADIVGFVPRKSDVVLLLGEVKTSRQKKSPPNVMSGRSGMVHQLDNLARNVKVHFSLFKWLHARCKGTEFWGMFKKAAKRYLNSGGGAIAVFGILVRDTKPDEMDLRNRGIALGKTVSKPTEVELNAWYLPCEIGDLSRLVDGDLN